jgi:hypothetical protein
MNFYKDPEGFDDRLLLIKQGTIEPYIPTEHKMAVRHERGGG